MQTIRWPARDLPVAAEVDVLVVGGGPAGLAATVAAARCGAATMLVERYGYLGGLATGGLVLYMAGLADSQGRRLVGGICWEAMERLRAIDALAEDGPLQLHVCPERLKVVADDLCLDAGARLRLHSWAAEALVEGWRVRGAVVVSKEGLHAVIARVTVDATGDGDLAASAGADHAVGTQRIGLNLRLGGVDRERLLAFEREHPDEARALRAQLRDQGGVPLRPNTTPDSDAGVYWINVVGLAARDTLGDDDSDDVHRLFTGRLSATSVDDLTHVEVSLRRRILDSLAFCRRHVPGFENARLLSYASQLGVRESRRIHGLHELSRDDLLGQRVFDDAVGMAGLGFAPDTPYQIPYRSLVPRTVDGLLVAGRCISVDHWGQQAIRLIPAAMVSGQAAGTAAALAAAQGVEPRAVDVGTLQQRLAEDGAILSVPEHEVQGGC